MQAARLAKRLLHRKLLVCLLVLVAVALLTVATIATGYSAEDNPASAGEPLSPATQVGLIAAWTAYVLAVFFRRPRTNEEAEV